MFSFIFAAMIALSAPAPGGVVLQPVANMYSSASQEADVVSQAIYGTTVGFVEEKNGWIKIRTPDDYTGWVPAAHLRRLGATEPPYASRGRIAHVTSMYAHLYRTPSVTKHAPLLTVPFETRLEVVAGPQKDKSGWTQVRLPDDRAAWLQAGDYTFDPKTLSTDEAIALARRFLGLPYTWGGTSTFGYDCSGYTQMLSRQRGVGIPRDAGPQANWDGMANVKKQELKPGDLLYFGSSLKKVTHTGMYIGNDEFIHATTHERPIIQISRLGEPYWTKLFVAARRLK